MIKMFCDVCGKLGGNFDLSVSKNAGELKLSMVVTVSAGAFPSHLCNSCARDLLQEALDKLNARILTEPA